MRTYCFRIIHSTHEVLVKLLLDSSTWPSVPKEWLRPNETVITEGRACYIGHKN